MYAELDMTHEEKILMVHFFMYAVGPWYSATCN